MRNLGLPLAILPIFILVVLSSQLLAGCMKLAANRLDSEGSAAQSAMSKAAETNAGYDSSYRDKQPTPAPGLADGTPAAPKHPAASGAADGVDEARLTAWLVPSAYAQDHGINERYMVRSGECQLTVEDYKQSALKLQEIAARFGGAVTDSRSTRLDDGALDGYVTLRVPNQSYQEAWNAVLNCGEVQSEQSGSQDVSQQYVGYVSSLKNLLAEQATLQKMLDEALAVQRARGLGEGYKIMLDTQQRLFGVTGQIQSTEDQLNALADRITRSTITAHLTQKKVIVAQAKEPFAWGFGATAGKAYLDLLVSLRALGKALIYFLITCWTWLVPLVLLGLLGRWAYKRWAVPHPAAVIVKTS